MRDTREALTSPAPNLMPQLMIWLSPAFPVGSFAYSHGLEYAAQSLGITHRASLTEWLCDLIERGSLRADLIVLAEAWCATSAADFARLTACNEFALALQPSGERHLETASQGGAFLAAVTASWHNVGLSEATLALGDEAAYPVAVGTAAAAHTIDREATALAYAIAFVSNIVSAGIRLSVVGQTDGQRIIADLLPKLGPCAEDALRSTLADLGSSVFAADLASMAHETQYTRLFRS